MTLSLGQNRIVNESEVKRRLEKASQDLRDARSSELSRGRRYLCAYGAARECALALAAATNDRGAFGERNLREAIERLLHRLALAPNIWHGATGWLNQPYLEAQLAPSEPNSAVLQCAILWAAILHADTVKRLTRRV